MFKPYCVKRVRIRSYSGPYFPAFELNTEICTEAATPRGSLKKAVPDLKYEQNLIILPKILEKILRKSPIPAKLQALSLQFY